MRSQIIVTDKILFSDYINQKIRNTLQLKEVQKNNNQYNFNN